MTSTESKNGAACFAKCMDSTAPIAKFGAINTDVLGLPASQDSTCSKRSAVKPVVPTTA